MSVKEFDVVKIEKIRIDGEEMCNILSYDLGLFSNRTSIAMHREEWEEIGKTMNWKQGKGVL